MESYVCPTLQVGGEILVVSPRNSNDFICNGRRVLSLIFSYCNAVLP